jgi:DNA repair photolyase
MPEPPLFARGASGNPPNRYERLHVDTDEPAAGVVPTTYFRDTSRSVLAENDSPDVGFRFSLNPYRGCEHGCIYCLGPDTSVLHADMRWRPIGAIQIGDVIAGFDEHPEPGRTRKLKMAVVEAVRWSRRPTLRLITEGSDVGTTAEHRWLQARACRWTRTDRLPGGMYLRRLPVLADEAIDDDYRVGYLAGLSLGDGTFRFQPGWRSNRLGFPQSYWRIALADGEPLERVVEYLGCFAVQAEARPFQGGPINRKPMRKVEIRSLPKLAVVHGLITADRDTRNYRRGFLAGFFDGEGHNGDSLRISQKDRTVLERVRAYASSLGFEFVLEPRPERASTLRLVGRLADRMRFFAVCRPAIARKVRGVFGKEMNCDPDVIHAVEPGAVSDVVDIQTSTRTFFAAGLATHNCYARPTHEYLGFSAGLDFESRIMVKDDAPVLLRRALASPRWEPQVVALSGNTDCYQPVERRLGLTRRCLEVFAEFRNPVGVVTKSALVARDADLLGALATHDAAHVCCSVTTLDAELARRMEPRAAQPAKRLDAIAALAAAGVPVAVLIGPVIPGLNDAEIPRILAAAKEAGARSASWVLLRLPKPVDVLFTRWLEEHFPDRRDRVLHRIQDTRAGRMSDAAFGRRKRGQGEYAAQIAALFAAAARKHGLDRPLPPLSAAAFRRPVERGDQLRLW